MARIKERKIIGMGIIYVPDELAEYIKSLGREYKSDVSRRGTVSDEELIIKMICKSAIQKIKLSDILN